MIIILITRNTEGSSQNSSGLPGQVKDQARTLLLRQGLRAMGMGALAELFTPDMLERTQDGKPFIPGLPDIHFNLSHSGDYMACAFSDREVGLDLQEHSRPHTSLVRIAKRFFSAREYEAILALPPEHSSVGPGHPKSAADFDNSARRLSLFYKLWTIKEAYLKYLGCGLRGGMNGYYPEPFPASGHTGEDWRGQIRILCEDPLLTPAQFALTRAPENYTMAVCSEILPEQIIVKVI